VARYSCQFLHGCDVVFQGNLLWLITLSLPTHTEPAWQTMAPSPLNGNSGRRPKPNHGKTMAEIKNKEKKGSGNRNTEQDGIATTTGANALARATVGHRDNNEVSSCVSLLQS